MAVIPASKILATIIKMYRASYLASAKMGAAGGPRVALMKALLGSKMMQPKITLNQMNKMAPEELLKMLKKGFQK